MLKKKLMIFLISFLILFAYLLIGNEIGKFIPCPIYKITGLYCPGCGITRMLLAMIKFDFFQAFRYNPLIFCFIPFLLFYYGDIIYSYYKKKKPFFSRFEPFLWYVLIFIFILYGVLRNISGFSFLIPTDI